MHSLTQMIAFSYNMEYVIERVYQVLDSICSKIVQRNYMGGVDLLNFLIETENYFNCHHSLFDSKNVNDNFRGKSTS